jgi:hypothetical protein
MEKIVVELLRSLILNSNMSVNEKEDNLLNLAKLDEKLAEAESTFSTNSEAEVKEDEEKEEAKP